VKRDEINQRLQQIIDDVTDPWGCQGDHGQVKLVALPGIMRRWPARQRPNAMGGPKVIPAHGELRAAETLGRHATGRRPPGVDTGRDMTFVRRNAVQGASAHRRANANRQDAMRSAWRSS
jgi:hypothetical protein